MHFHPTPRTIESMAIPKQINVRKSGFLQYAREIKTSQILTMTVKDK